MFLPNFSNDLAYYLENTPDGWHILYLGGSFGKQPKRINADFTQQVETWGAFAYIVHKRAYKGLIKLLYMANKICDAMYIEYQKNYLCVKPNRKLVLHPKGYSTIKEKEVNYSGIV